MMPWQPWYPSPIDMFLGLRKVRRAKKADRPEE